MCVSKHNPNLDINAVGSPTAMMHYMISACSAMALLKAAIFCLCLSLTLWRSHDCIERYLEFRRSTVVKMMPLQATIMPALVLCPSFKFAYSEERLRRLGIPDSTAYRKGNFKGKSAGTEKEIFENVSFSIDQLLDHF